MVLLGVDAGEVVASVYAWCCATVDDAASMRR